MRVCAWMFVHTYLFVYDACVCSCVHICASNIYIADENCDKYLYG